MTLHKAIEILTAVIEGGKLITDQEQREATKLGLEALKLHKYTRSIGQHTDPILLPGETLGVG